MTKRHMVRIDVGDVKQRARGHWHQILEAVAGIPRESLDGKPHPCPKCGGKDRFRVIDQQAGAVLCNQCLKQKNSDGISAVQWMLNIRFTEAIKRIADFLGIAPQCESICPPLDPLDELCRAKRMPKASAVAYGAKVVGTSVSFPSFAPAGSVESMFTIWPAGTDKQRKRLWPKGGKAGVFLPVQSDGSPRLPRPGETWLVVEGVKDAAALHSLGYLAMGMPTCKLPVQFVNLMRGINVVLIPDRDTAGIDGAETTARRLCGVAANLRIATLPRPPENVSSSTRNSPTPLWHYFSAPGPTLWLRQHSCPLRVTAGS